LFLLLLLACPLAMMFMMRGMMHGGHGHAESREEGTQQGGGHGGCHSGSHDHESGEASLEDLRSRRTELDREIADREHAESAPAHSHH
jgi:hypothetical protein